MAKRNRVTHADRLSHLEQKIDEVDERETERRIQRKLLVRAAKVIFWLLSIGAAVVKLIKG